MGPPEVKGDQGDKEMARGWQADETWLVGDRLLLKGGVARSEGKDEFGVAGVATPIWRETFGNTKTMYPI